MYAQVCTRPDIPFALSLLGRYQSNPGHAYWIVAKKVLRYLQKTKDYKLVYRRSDKLELLGYYDSDFAGCQDSLKSTSSYIFMMAGGAISWKSMKHKNVATSTMMAEYMACYEATSQAVWIGKFIEGMRVLHIVTNPLKIFCDSTAAIFYSKNNKRSSGTKHMHIKYKLVREKIKQGFIKISYIHTESMLADPLNKPLPVMSFKKHVENMGLISNLDMLS
ncbi:secreted RxLR effector protein 161-like [Malus sylvestris]|uniref:secreted RxLR effector protein 161-like n=1 Tax=Malus sylvestris TaxID=3752 RepID=UPI0021AC1E16|nr:secreted RxLR effector protein 161-like [Malus sylvestris]